MAASKAPGVFDRVSPPERLVDPAEAWHLSELGSACGNPDLAAHSRIDPYWSGMWSGGPTATWISRAVAEKQNDAGIGSFPDELVQDRDKSMAQLMHQAPKSTHTLADRMAFLGVVHGWRTCNVQQVATMTGNTEIAKPSSKVASAMFSAGLVDLAKPAMAKRRAQLFGPDSLYRPGRPEAFDALAEKLTWAEWVAVTGGQPWSAGGQNDRHNLLATELGLRLAEYTEVGTVLGETLSTVDLLTGSGVGRTPVVGDQRAADMTVVRPDGMRIAVELTASITARFDHKVERWVQLLAESPMSATGLTVIFLVAQPIDETKKAVWANAHQAVMKAVRKHPGVSLDPTSLRIGVASWREWFPSSHTASEAFLSMRAHRPDGDGWTDADFLDPDAVPFAATNPDVMRAILDNAAMLGQTPHWLRRPDRAPSLAPELLAANGLDEIPAFHTGSPRSQGKVVHPLDERGCSGAPKLPKRLLGLAG